MCAQLCLSLCDLMVCSHQAPLSMEFSRQEYWSRLPFPTPGDLPDPGMEPASPGLTGRFFTTVTGKCYCASHQDKNIFFKFTAPSRTHRSLFIDRRYW